MGVRTNGMTHRASAPTSLEPVILGLHQAMVADFLQSDATWVSRDDPEVHEPRGLVIRQGRDCLVRLYVDAAAGVYLCEYSAASPADQFELFVVPHVEGDMRAGWRRRWAGADAGPPPAWSAVLACLAVGEPVATRSEPDFALMLATLVAAETPAISLRDTDSLASLQADVRHLREVSDRQAEQLRKAQGALLGRLDAASAPVEAQEDAGRQWLLRDIAEWADLHSDTLTILPRAIAEARKSPCEHQALVFDALDMLAHTYRLVKLSELPREDLKAKADQLGLFIGGSVDPAVASQYRDAYFVMFGGRRRWLDQHVGRGVSRDPRFCVRVYFFWDDESRRVVVGWLPSHLPNSLT